MDSRNTDRRQAQEAHRDYTVQEFAALPKKFRDKYLALAAEVAARDMEDRQAQEAPKAASQGAEVFAYKLQEFAKGLEVPTIGSITEAVRFYESATKAERDAWIPLIEADRAAQRQAGREDVMRATDRIITKMREGYASVVGLLREAKEFVEIYKARNPKWLSGDSVQDPSGAHKLSESISKALSDLDAKPDAGKGD